MFLCACLSRKCRYEYILPLAGVLFHGTFNNLYNLIPLLYISQIRTAREFFKFMLWWMLFYVLGYASAQLMTKLISGQFIQIEAWRGHHYITSFAVLAQNLKRVLPDAHEHLRVFGYTNTALCALTVAACLWKKSLTVFQMLLLLSVGTACYAQSSAVGIGMSMRTVFPLCAALLAPFCFALQSKNWSLLVLSMILLVSTSLFTDNINALKYYNGVTSVWKKYLSEIPVDPRLNGRLVFLGNDSECLRIGQHLTWTMSLNNRIIDPLDRLIRWSPTALSLGYRHVIFIGVSENDDKSAAPKWLDECKFQSNPLYQWAVLNGTVVARFNPELLNRIK